MSVSVSDTTQQQNKIGTVGKISWIVCCKNLNVPLPRLGKSGPKNFGRIKSAICALLGACLSCAQQEAKDSLVSEQISYIEHTVLKSEIEVLKSSLAFERETGEKL